MNGVFFYLKGGSSEFNYMKLMVSVKTHSYKNLNCFATNKTPALF